ncbi:MAG: sigma-70 family RNA polymerase sigma factor [bacterium]
MEDLRTIYSKIYDQQVEKIYRFVYIKVNSQTLAEDITAETFTRGWEAVQAKGKGGHGTMPIENVTAFLYRIARNMVIDYYRTKERTRTTSLDNVSLTDPRLDISQAAIVSSDIDQVRTVLSSLKEDYQNVIIWHYIDSLSIGEVAKLLNRSEEATRVLLSRALKGLREKMSQEA